MPAFQYIAKDDSGKEIRGALEVATEAELQLRLQAENLYLVSAKLQKPRNYRPLKGAILADYCRQIGSLVGAGVSLVRALAMIAEEEGLKPLYREIYINITKEVRQGTPLSTAMENQGRAFPPLVVYMFRAAEASGRLEQTALQIAVHYEKDSRLNAKVKSSMLYPKILIFLLICAVTVLMAFVMPQFSELFALMDELPLATRILFGISDLVRNYWLLLIVVIAILVVGIKILFKLDRVQYYWGKLLVKIPKIGHLLRTIYTARFARTLSSLYSCGISIVPALQISKNVIGNRYIESQFDTMIQDVRAGTLLSEAIGRIDGLAKKLPSSVRIGEESGNLEDILLHMADNFDYESDQSLTRLVAILEPAMIIVMAVVVAFFLYAVMMPIYNSYSAMSEMG